MTGCKLLENAKIMTSNKIVHLFPFEYFWFIFRII